jgi:hypothetical protein
VLPKLANRLPEPQSEPTRHAKQKGATVANEPIDVPGDDDVSEDQNDTSTSIPDETASLDEAIEPTASAPANTAQAFKRSAQTTIKVGS